MACSSAQKRSNLQTKIQLEVDRMLYVRNLPRDITEAEVYAIFGKYGPVDSIRIGKTAEAEGTAFVVYQDVFYAQNAYESSKGVRVGDRYPLILYYHNRVSCQRSDAADKLKRKREKMGRIGFRPKLILSDD